MKPLENIFARCNHAACISHSQHNAAAVGRCAHADPTARPIILSRVLQEILHNQRCVPFFAGHKQPAWKFLLDLHVGRIGQRAKIVQPFIDELAKVDWC